MEPSNLEVREAQVVALLTFYEVCCALPRVNIPDRGGIIMSARIYSAFAHNKSLRGTGCLAASNGCRTCSGNLITFGRRYDTCVSLFWGVPYHIEDLRKMPRRISMFIDNEYKEHRAKSGLPGLTIYDECRVPRVELCYKAAEILEFALNEAKLYARKLPIDAQTQRVWGY